MVATPHKIIDSVLRSVCGRGAEHLVPLTGGGMNETYRARLDNGSSVVARIARQGRPWFVDESHLMAQAREAGVPTAQVLGLEHREDDGALLSFSIQQFLPGRSLAELIGELPVSELDRLVLDAGEVMARVHSVGPDSGHGIRHELRQPEERSVAQIARTVASTLGPAAAAVIERGADYLQREIAARPVPTPLRLAQGDFLPKNILVDNEKIVGVIDWEFAGPAPPAFDLGRWEVSAGDPLHDRSDLIHRGYARVTDPDSAAAGLTPAFAIDWTLEMLAWKNPASAEQVRRCVDMIARYASRRVSER